MRRILLILCLASFCSLAIAQQQSLEPEVVITPGDNERVKEYRVNGQLYMIEVVPTKGVPYFLVDTDGDGQLETRRNDLGTGIMIPSWTLATW